MIMAKMTLGMKAERVLRFQLGLRRRDVATALAAYGFDEQEQEKGWQLLRACGGNRLNVQPDKAPDPVLVDRVDAWENTWFVVTEATLRHSFPAVADRVFMNLAQTTGPEV